MKEVDSLQLAKMRIYVIAFDSFRRLLAAWSLSRLLLYTFSDTLLCLRESPLALFACNVRFCDRFLQFPDLLLDLLHLGGKILSEFKPKFPRRLMIEVAKFEVEVEVLPQKRDGIYCFLAFRLQHKPCRPEKVLVISLIDTWTTQS